MSAGRGREREVVRRGGVREEGVGYKKKKKEGKKGWERRARKDEGERNREREW